MNLDQDTLDAIDATLPPCPLCGGKTTFEPATCTDQDCCGQQDEIECTAPGCLWASFDVQDILDLFNLD